MNTRINNDVDICIVDTAGRLQTQKNLMTELTKIRDSMRKQIPEAPHEVLLVLDATTGQNGISQASNFAEAAGCTGIVLAKLDGTAKGGVVVAIRQQIGLPVKYIGVGEQHEDLVLFNPDAFVDEMFDDASSALVSRTRKVNRPRGALAEGGATGLGTCTCLGTCPKSGPGVPFFGAHPFRQHPGR